MNLRYTKFVFLKPHKLESTNLYSTKIGFVLKPQKLEPTNLNEFTIPLPANIVALKSGRLWLI